MFGGIYNSYTKLLFYPNEYHYGGRWEVPHTQRDPTGQLWERVVSSWPPTNSVIEDDLSYAPPTRKYRDGHDPTRGTNSEEKPNLRRSPTPLYRAGFTNTSSTSSYSPKELTPLTEDDETAIETFGWSGNTHVLERQNHPYGLLTLPGCGHSRIYTKMEVKKRTNIP